MKSESIKVVGVGDRICEGTRFCYELKNLKDYDNNEYVPTVFDNYTLDNYRIHGKRCKIQLWDTTAQEELDNIRKLTYANTDLFIILYSAIKIYSLEKAENFWYKEIKDFFQTKNINISLIGVDKNKRDTAPQSDVIHEKEIQECAKRLKAIYFNQCDLSVVSSVIHTFLESLNALPTSGKNTTWESKDPNLIHFELGLDNNQSLFFPKQIYNIINNYSKQTIIKYNNFSNEIIKNIFKENRFQNEIQFLIYSLIHQIEFIIFSNKGHETNIFKAIQNNELEDVIYLIENCFCSIDDRNEEGKSVLSYSFDSNNQIIYNYLLSKKDSIEFLPIKEKPNDYEPDIFKASKNGQLTSIQWLIEQENINKNKRDSEFNTPIHIASMSGHLPIVEYFIEKQNIDQDIQGSHERTPLHYACLNGHFHIVLYLISKGANLEAKNIYNKTPLHCACENGHLQIVKYLISKGSNLEAKDEEGWTPLHFASKFDQIDVVKYLIRKGANKTIENIDGRTPFDLLNNKVIRNILK